MRDAELKEILLVEMAKLKSRLAAAELDIQQYKNNLQRKLKNEKDK